MLARSFVDAVRRPAAASGVRLRVILGDRSRARPPACRQGKPDDQEHRLPRWPRGSDGASRRSGRLEVRRASETERRRAVEGSACVTTVNDHDVNSWSGITCPLACALVDDATDIECIGLVRGAASTHQGAEAAARPTLSKVPFRLKFTRCGGESITATGGAANESGPFVRGAELGCRGACLAS